MSWLQRVTHGGAEGCASVGHCLRWARCAPTNRPPLAWDSPWCLPEQVQVRPQQVPSTFLPIAAGTVSGSGEVTPEGPGFGPLTSPVSDLEGQHSSSGLDSVDPVPVVNGFSLVAVGLSDPQVIACCCLFVLIVACSCLCRPEPRGPGPCRGSRTLYQLSFCLLAVQLQRGWKLLAPDATKRAFAATSGSEADWEPDEDSDTDMAGCPEVRQ